MSVALDEQALGDVASNGEMDYDKWPAIVEPLLERLNQIVYTDFPMPRPYPNVDQSQIPSSPSQAHVTPTRDPNTNLQAPSTPVRNLPPVPPFPDSSATNTTRVPDSLPPSQDPNGGSLDELPSLLLQLLENIIQTLRAAFSERPPHTIQRLAELILYPTKHYKTLPAWLRALDRVVSVSSSADIFPLSETPALVNGVNGYDRDALGSDESLGGALLTPIPWLRNSMAEDTGEDSTQADTNDSGHSDNITDAMSLANTQANAGPLVPEREDGAVTQGELMRMEQEAGVVPSTQHPQDTNTIRTMSDAEDGAYMEDGDLVPHARGPDMVGSVDMGRVGGKDVEVHIGSPPSELDENKLVNANDAQTVLPGHEAHTKPDATNEASSAADSEEFEIVLKDQPVADDSMQLDEADTHNRDTKPQSGPAHDQDSDIVLVDADGKTEDEGSSKADASGENIGADAADTSTVT